MKVYAIDVDADETCYFCTEREAMRFARVLRKDVSSSCTITVTKVQLAKLTPRKLVVRALNNFAFVESSEIIYRSEAI